MHFNMLVKQSKNWMKDSTCIRQVFNIHQSIGIAKYFVTILQNVLNDRAKVLKKWKKMETIKEEQWIHLLLESKKLRGRMNQTKFTKGIFNGKRCFLYSDTFTDKPFLSKAFLESLWNLALLTLSWRWSWSYRSKSIVEQINGLDSIW